MKSQKLKLQDIKVGDRIIVISKSGKTRAIIEVEKIKYACQYLENVDGNTFYYDKCDFYICPPAFTIVPNMMVDSLKEPIIIVGQYTNITTAFVRKDTMNSTNISTGDVLTCTIQPIPDEPEYKEITIADIEAKFGCKVKIMDGGK